jgi:hypothetical protein
VAVGHRAQLAYPHSDELARKPLRHVRLCASVLRSVLETRGRSHVSVLRLLRRLP